MYQITSCEGEVLGFAAAELKMHLQMMPGWGDISISYKPDAKDGFPAGLLGLNEQRHYPNLWLLILIEMPQLRQI